MALTIVLWKWMQPAPRTVYTEEHVNAMAQMLHRNLARVKHRIICVTDNPRGIRVETFPLWDDFNDLANASGRQLPSCYRRLKLYNPQTQHSLGIREGDRIMSIDIDAVITKDISDLVLTKGRFVGWELPGVNLPRVFNGSLQMFTAGDLQFIWDAFDPAFSPQRANRAGYFGSDQAWISYNLIPKPDCIGIKYPQIASYQQHVIPLRQHVRPTQIVFFNGRLKPWYPQVNKDTPWVTKHWSNENEANAV